MKTAIIVSFILWTLLLNAQENKNYLENNTFISKVGSMCEETNIPDPCAGAQIYLILMFKKEYVFISEKYISTCDKVEIIKIGCFKWGLSENNEVKIDYNPDINKVIEYEFNFSIFMDNLTFELIDNRLRGKEKRKNKVIEYIFLKNSE
jgi:hypothetical protein